MTTVSTDAGSQLLAKFLDGQIKRLVESVNAINGSHIPRVARLFSLYSAVIEDTISIRILCENARINQAYIVSRALLERLTNEAYAKEQDATDQNLYSQAQMRARSERVGLWQDGNPTPPWTWRRTLKHADR